MKTVSLKDIFRKMFKHKFMSVSNILGFSLSIAFCIYTLLYIFNEFSYDKFHDDYNRIYRVVSEKVDKDGNVSQNAITNNPLGRELDRNMSEVSDNLKVHMASTDYRVEVGNKMIALKRAYVEPNFFNFFSFKLLQGDPDKLLEAPNSIVLTESSAKRIFGDEDPMGKLVGEERGSMMVTGVCEDIPENSHISFDCLISWNLLDYMYGSDWSSHWARIAGFTYIKLAENANVEDLKGKLPQFTERFLGDKMRKENSKIKFLLQPLHKIYLHSNFANEAKDNNNILLIRILIYICIFLLLMSMVNYINFSLMVNIERAKEIGIRKINGSTRFQVFLHFLVESLIYNFISLFFVIFILVLALPFLNKTFGINITYNIFSTYMFWLVLGSLFVFNSFVSILYPTFVLSNLNPVNVLKGRFVNTKSGKILRSILLTVQFIIAIALLFGVFVIGGQVKYFSKKDIGFEYKNTLLVNDGSPTVTLNSTKFIRDELIKIPEIDDVAFARFTPGDTKYKGSTIVTLEGQDCSHTMFMLQIGSNFTSFFNIDMIAGRIPGYEEYFADKVLLNRKAADMLKVNSYDELIGKMTTQTLGNTFLSKEIVGVVENYHQYSLKEPMYPLILNLPLVPGGYSCIRFNENVEKSKALEIAKNFWDTNFPEKDFVYEWHENFYNRLYKKDNQFKAMFDILNFIVIILILVGTGSLSLLIIRQKTKEVAIYKLFGANVIRIVLYNSYYFIVIAAVAMLISLPIASRIFSGWLDNFANHIKLGFIYYLLPCLIIISVILISVLLSTIKQIRANTLESLKYE